MYNQWGITAAVAALVFVAGCGQGISDDDPGEESDEQTGMAISVSFNDETDVDGFEFGFRDCENEEVVAQQTKSLDELVVPGEVPDDVQAPFDDDSGYQFADHFQSLNNGCYDVEVQPVTEFGEASSSCSMVEATEVFVVDGKTTDVVLLSECDGQKHGASDVVGALNRPPTIESVDYDPSKFVHECEAVDICVTAYDPDGDPMEFEFEQTDGQQLRFDLEVTEPEVDGKRATSCMRAVPLWNDDYHFTVTVYDQFVDDGKKVRFDDSTEQMSSDQMSFPMYSNWDIELECYDTETELFHHFKGVRQIERAEQNGEQCIPIWPEEYYCSDFHWDETDRTCPDGEFKPETVYPLCEDIDSSKYESEGRKLGEERW